MELVNEIIQYFSVPALFMGLLLTSLSVGVVNQSEWGKTHHNLWIALLPAILFAGVMSPWETWGTDWRLVVIQFSVTSMSSCLFAITRGQLAVDRFLSFLAEKMGPKQ